MSILATQADMIAEMKMPQPTNIQEEPAEVVETTEVAEPAPVATNTDNKKKQKQQQPAMPAKETTLPAVGESVSASNQQGTTSNSSTSQHSQSSSQKVDFNPEEMGDLYKRSMQAVGYTDPQIIATLQGLGYDPNSRKAEYEEEQRRLNNISKFRAIGNAFQLFNEMGSLAHGDASVQARDIKDEEAPLREKRRAEYQQNLDKYNNILLQSALARSNTMLNKAGEAATTRTGMSTSSGSQQSNGASNTSGTSHGITYGTGYSTRRTSGGSKSGGGGGKKIQTVSRAVTNRTGNASLGNISLTASQPNFNNAFNMCFNLDGKNAEIAQTIQSVITPQEWQEKAGGGRTEASTVAAVNSVVAALYSGICQQIDAALVLSKGNKQKTRELLDKDPTYAKYYKALEAIFDNGISIQPNLSSKYNEFL